MPRVFTSSIAVLSALLCALSLGVVAAPAAHAADPVRLLLTGDSITHGRHGDYTWRYRLDREFRRQGVPFNFVGSKSLPFQDNGYPTSTYADPNFDRDHFAQLGQEIREMVPRIDDEVREHQPDVVVLAAGVNDFRHHQGDADIVEKTKANLRAWIDNVQDAKSDTRILLSPVLLVDTPAASVLNPRIKAYNSALAGIANEMKTDDSPITVADTNRGWDPKGPMTLDGLHPTPTGDTLISQRIAEALRAAGILTGSTPGRADRRLAAHRASGRQGQRHPRHGDVGAAHDRLGPGALPAARPRCGDREGRTRPPATRRSTSRPGRRTASGCRCGAARWSAPGVRPSARASRPRPDRRPPPGSR